MGRRSSSPLGLVALVCSVGGCTGAIPEPLSLGSAVEIGGWLVIRSGEEDLQVLRRSEDQGGEPRFVGVDGVPSGSVTLPSATAMSIWALQPNQLVLFEEGNVRRAPGLDELSLTLDPAEARRCACPIPRMGGVTRVLSGATCALPSSEARSFSWDGEVWVETAGAREPVWIHVGGEACLPTVEELLDAEVPRVEFGTPVELPNEPTRVGRYLHFEILEDGAFFVLGAFGSVLLRAGDEPWVRPYEPFEEPGRAPSWPIRATLRVDDGSVIGAVPEISAALPESVSVFLVGPGLGQQPIVPIPVLSINPPRKVSISEALQVRLSTGYADEAFLSVLGPQGWELSALPVSGLRESVKPAPSHSARAGVLLPCPTGAWIRSERPCPGPETCEMSDVGARQHTFVLDQDWSTDFGPEDGPAWPASWDSAELHCLRHDLVLEVARSSTSSLGAWTLWTQSDSGADEAPTWRVARAQAPDPQTCGTGGGALFALELAGQPALLRADGRLVSPSGVCAGGPSQAVDLVGVRRSPATGELWLLEASGQLLPIQESPRPETPL